jgi:hypothetical protein
MGQLKWAIVCAFALAPLTSRQVAAQEASQKKAEQESGQAAVSPRDAQRRIEAVLAERLRSPLEFLDTPLNTIMGVIADEYDIPIQFDKAALEAAAASPDQSVSVNLRNVSLRSTLELILGEVPDLSFLVEREVLLITTADEASKHLQTRVYRVDDLIDAKGPHAADDFSVLQHALTSCIEKDSWAANGKGEGEVVLLEPGMMLVTQTQRVHRQIVDVMDDLRHVKRAIDRGAPDPSEVSLVAEPRAKNDRRAPAAAADARRGGEADPFGSP